MKTHLSLRTRDLDASVEFYKTLLQTEPLKHYDDYALFINDDPGIELALHPSAGEIRPEGAHYGIVVSDPDSVDSAIQRLSTAGLELDVEREETCCYAKQTKVWATDPDGRRWEVYTVLEEAEQSGDNPPGCCGSQTDPCCSDTRSEPAA